ncbi:MAG: HAD-IG family 5'-nucleotidase [Myxococcota bacterium]|nr:HAD-IG family 5'-nucleotidase [Myxococcota bacterium]
MSGQKVEPSAATISNQPMDFTEKYHLSPQRKIFVNRNLRFEQIQMIGFDMDYTLLKYRKQSIEALSYKLTVEKLIKQYGYPPELDSMVYDPAFVVRGLVVDKKTGNIFKMDHHNHVGRVYHGRRLLSREERKSLYRNAKIRLSGPRYHWIDTMFALPEAVLYADIIDLFELRLGRKRIDFRQLFEDIRGAIDECHRDDSLKSVIRSNFAEFIEEDPDLPVALHKLRSAGKKLFVLTNSYGPYTQAAMSHLLDGKLSEYPVWQNYFDFTIVGASKPAFFNEDRKFLALDKTTGDVVENVEITALDRQFIFQGGSVSEFERFIDVPGEEILYVGDHIYGDIIRSKKESLWRTALVLEEMEEEIGVARQKRDAQSQLIALEEERSMLEHEITQKKLLSNVKNGDETEGRANFDKKQLRLEIDISKKELRSLIEQRDRVESEIDRAYNPYWGSVFKEGNDNSCFGRQVERYACLYTSRVSNFRFYSPVQYFRSPRHWMAHEKL